MIEKKQKGRYGRYIKTLISGIDILLLNAVFMYFCHFPELDKTLNSPIMWIMLNFSYLIAFVTFGNVHEQRFILTEKLVINALKMVLTFGVVFFALITLTNTDGFGVKRLCLFFFCYAIVLIIWWLASRLLVKALRSRGFNYKRAIVIGDGRTALRLLETMLSDDGFGYKIIGFFGNSNVSKNNPYYEGGLDEVESFVKRNPVDEMFCAVSDNPVYNAQHYIKIAEANAVDFYFVPPIIPKMLRQFELHNIGDIPALTMRRNPLNVTVNRLIKRGMDVFVSSMFLLISPIIFIPVAVAIKLNSRGPVFFTQMRTGYRGEPFKLYKFRTMKVNEDSDVLQASKDDPRKTRLGNFLRKTSIDEMPQFYNVLKGDMSVIGPRPHMLKHTEDYSKTIENYMLRHTIKPGITGWAQVNGFRGETRYNWQMQKRVEFDVWYAENWSFPLDMKILLKTVANAIKGEKNAY